MKFLDKLKIWKETHKEVVTITTNSDQYISGQNIQLQQEIDIIAQKRLWNVVKISDLTTTVVGNKVIQSAIVKFKNK